MTTPPRLAVHVGRDVPPALGAVLAAAAPWVEVLTASVQEPLPPGVVAHLYTGDVLPRRPAAPFALWQLEPGPPPGPPAALVLCAAGSPVAGTAPDALVVSTTPWPEHARPVLPFTRSALRELRGLPGTVVTVATDGGVTWGAPDARPAAAPATAWPSLAGLSSVVIATGEPAWTALAWAAPLVTDAATAAGLGLVDGRDCVVAGTPTARRAAAVALAADDLRAARTAQHGHARARAGRPAAAAEQLCRVLGIPGPRLDVAAPARLLQELDALGTPSGAFVRARAREATAPLPGAVTSGWRPRQGGPA